jgi:hypothetical protein
LTAPTVVEQTVPTIDEGCGAERHSSTTAPRPSASLADLDYSSQASSPSAVSSPHPSSFPPPTFSTIVDQQGESPKHSS